MSRFYRYQPPITKTNYNDPIYETDLNETPLNLIEQEDENDYDSESSTLEILFDPKSVVPTKRTSRISYIAIVIIGSVHV